MSGNVWEWCFDWEEVDAHEVPERKEYRGGGFESVADLLQLGVEFTNFPNNIGVNLGFRPVRTE